MKKRDYILIVVAIPVAFFVFVGIGVLGLHFGGGTTHTTSPNLCGSITQATPQSILSAFKSNQASANSQWLGNTICFSDYVGSVNQVSGGQYASCISYLQSQYDNCSGSLNTYDGWVIYYWVNSQTAASVPTHPAYFTATCVVTAYQGYGSFSSFGYKALILNNCQLLS